MPTAVSGRDDDWGGHTRPRRQRTRTHAGRCGTRWRGERTRAHPPAGKRVGGLVATDGAGPQERDGGPNTAHHPLRRKESRLRLSGRKAETAALPLTLPWRRWGRAMPPPGCGRPLGRRTSSPPSTRSPPDGAASPGSRGGAARSPTSTSVLPRSAPSTYPSPSSRRTGPRQQGFQWVPLGTFRCPSRWQPRWPWRHDPQSRAGRRGTCSGGLGSRFPRTRAKRSQCSIPMVWTPGAHDRAQESPSPSILRRPNLGTARLTVRP